METNGARVGVDFHIHYTDETARTIIDEACAADLKAIALIGRAEISDNIADFVDYGKEKGIEVFNGVEMLARVNGQRVDLIGIGFDQNHQQIRYYFGKRESTPLNAEIATKQKDFLEGQGFVVAPVDEDSSKLLRALLAGEITEKAIQYCKLVVRQPENASLIDRLRSEHLEVRQEIQENYSEREGYKGNPEMLTAKFLWSHFFAVGKPGYIPIEPKAEDFIHAVQDAGGVVLYSPEGHFDREIWEELLEKGVDGMMAWHGEKLEVGKELIREIRQNGKLILGGSDYNPALEDWKIGKGSGHMFIGQKRLEELKHYLGRREAGTKNR